MSVMDAGSIAYTSYKDTAVAGDLPPIPHGGIIAHIDALDRKGYISILLRGKGARRTLFQVYPNGDGPREYSPFHHGMVAAPMHLGVPLPSGFAGWARGKSTLDGVKHWGRCVTVIRRWFSEAGIEPARKEREEARALVYPFLQSAKRTPEHALLRKVNEVVPRHLPPDRRADICQDILVGVLSGEIPEDALDASVAHFTRRALRLHPLQFGDLSLDAPFGDDTDRTIMDTLVAESTRWDEA